MATKYLKFNVMHVSSSLDGNRLFSLIADSTNTARKNNNSTFSVPNVEQVIEGQVVSSTYNHANEINFLERQKAEAAIVFVNVGASVVHPNSEIKRLLELLQKQGKKDAPLFIIGINDDGTHLSQQFSALADQMGIVYLETNSLGLKQTLEDVSLLTLPSLAISPQSLVVNNNNNNNNVQPQKLKQVLVMIDESQIEQKVFKTTSMSFSPLVAGWSRWRGREIFCKEIPTEGIEILLVLHNDNGNSRYNVMDSIGFSSCLKSGESNSDKEALVLYNSLESKIRWESNFNRNYDIDIAPLTTFSLNGKINSLEELQSSVVAGLRQGAQKRLELLKEKDDTKTLQTLLNGKFTPVSFVGKHLSFLSQGNDNNKANKNKPLAIIRSLRPDSKNPSKKIVHYSIKGEMKELDVNTKAEIQSQLKAKNYKLVARSVENKKAHKIYAIEILDQEAPLVLSQNNNNNNNNNNVLPGSSSVKPSVSIVSAKPVVPSTPQADVAPNTSSDLVKKHWKEFSSDLKKHIRSSLDKRHGLECPISLDTITVPIQLKGTNNTIYDLDSILDLIISSLAAKKLKNPLTRDEYIFSSISECLNLHIIHVTDEVIDEIKAIEAVEKYQVKESEDASKKVVTQSILVVQDNNNNGIISNNKAPSLTPAISIPKNGASLFARSDVAPNNSSYLIKNHWNDFPLELKEHVRLSLTKSYKSQVNVLSNGTLKVPVQLQGQNSFIYDLDFLIESINETIKSCKERNMKYVDLVTDKEYSFSSLTDFLTKHVTNVNDQKLALIMNDQKLALIMKEHDGRYDNGLDDDDSSYSSSGSYSS
ncbi:MAG: hypothetical protein HKM04_00200 [Legionellales bacterium]|nr:hypothetical protein [Legionellales bacterium]